MSPIILVDLIAFAALVIAWMVLPNNSQLRERKSALEALMAA
jgi:hypothetical protein